MTKTVIKILDDPVRIEKNIQEFKKRCSRLLIILGVFVQKGKMDPQGGKCENSGKGNPRKYGWVESMKRVFGFEVLKCDRCGGRRRILCAINPPGVVRKTLDCLGLPPRPLGVSPAVLDHPFDY